MITIESLDLYEWMMGHPYLATFIMIMIVHYSFESFENILSTIQVVFRGWPTNKHINNKEE